MSFVAFRDSTNTMGSAHNVVAGKQEVQASDSKSKDVTASQALELDTSFEGDSTPFLDDQSSVDNDENATEDSSLISLGDSLTAEDLNSSTKIEDENGASMSTKASSTTDGEQCVSVFLRVRPFTQAEESRSEKEALTVVSSEDGTTALDVNGETHRYQFTRVMGPESTQADIYESVGAPAVEGALKSNKFSFLFTHGVSNSGKSFTVLGNSANQGLLPRIVSNFAESTKDSDNMRLTLSVLEVTGKCMKDLIEPDNSVVFKDKGKKRVSNFSVDNLSEHSFERMEKANSLINSALSRRATAATGMNEESSRSHALFIIKCYSSEDKDEEEQCIGGITLVDMAGAERIDKSCAYTEGADNKDTQQRTKESGQINGSLFALFECFRELQRCSKSSKNSGTLDARKVNPVFRRQKEPLVKIIQPYLTGQIGKTKSSQVMVLLTAYPGYKDVGEKKSVFRQAQNALGTSMKFSNIPSRISTYRPNKSKGAKLGQSRSKRDRDAEDQLVGTNTDEDEYGTAESPQKRRHTNDGVVSAPLSGKKGIYLHILRMKVAREARDAAIRRFSCPTPKSTKKSVSKMKRSTQKRNTPKREESSTNETPRKLDFSFKQNDETVDTKATGEFRFTQGLLSKMVIGVKQILEPPHSCPVLENGQFEDHADATYLKEASTDEKQFMIDRVLNSVRNQFVDFRALQQKKDEELQEAESRAAKYKEDNKEKDDEILKAKSRISELLERLDNAESERNELHATVAHKQKELDQVTEHFTSRRGDMVKLRTELSRAQAELSNVNSDYEALSTEYEELKEQAASLQETIGLLREQSAMKQEDLRSMGERAVVYGSTEIASLKKQLEDSNCTKQELQGRIASLGKENSTFRQQLASVEEDLNKASRLNKSYSESLAETQADNSALQERLRRVETQNREQHANMKARIIAAKNSRRELSAQLEDHKEQLHKTQEQKAREVLSLSQQLESTKTELDRLKVEFQTQSSSLRETREADRAETGKTFAKLQRELRVKSDRIMLLNQRVHVAEGNLTERGYALVASKERQTNQELAVLSLQKELQELEESKVVAELDSSEIKRALDGKTRRASELEEQVASLDNARSKLQKCLETRTENEQRFKQEAEQKRGQIEELHQALQETRRELGDTRQELQAYSNNYVSTKTDLEAENQELKETIASLEKELDSTRQSLERVQSHYVEMFNERKQLKEVLGIPQNEVSVAPAEPTRSAQEQTKNLTYAQTVSFKMSKSAQTQCHNSITPRDSNSAESLVETLTTQACAKDGELLNTIRRIKDGREQIIQRINQLNRLKKKLESQLTEESGRREKVEKQLAESNRELTSLRSQVQTEIEPKNHKIKSLESKQKLLRSLIASLVSGLRHKRSWRKPAAVAWANFLGVNREELCRAFLEGRYEKFERALADECGNTVAEYFVEIMDSYSADTKDSIPAKVSDDSEAFSDFTKAGRNGKPV
eukprot:gb/GECG01007720.1/.p1 GENE.gb/GECG01007720.1/~~gb/GECG01007720.1/.p1  ORF type:complete len:1466 (+),score=293.70 gb/GECG01007720.1/:1-4398(+)